MWNFDDDLLDGLHDSHDGLRLFDDDDDMIADSDLDFEDSMDREGNSGCLSWLILYYIWKRWFR